MIGRLVLQLDDIRMHGYFEASESIASSTLFIMLPHGEVVKFSA
jgi:hypothetical protein